MQRCIYENDIIQTTWSKNFRDLEIDRELQADARSQLQWSDIYKWIALNSILQTPKGLSDFLDHFIHEYRWQIYL